MCMAGVGMTICGELPSMPFHFLNLKFLCSKYMTNGLVIFNTSGVLLYGWLQRSGRKSLSRWRWDKLWKMLWFPKWEKLLYVKWKVRKLVSEDGLICDECWLNMHPLEKNTSNINLVNSSLSWQKRKSCIEKEKDQKMIPQKGVMNP